MNGANLLIDFVLFNPQLIFWCVGVVCAAYSFLWGLMLNISKLMEDKLSSLMERKSCDFCKFDGWCWMSGMCKWHIFIFPVVPATTVGLHLYKQSTGLFHLINRPTNAHV
jgi:hypothetical protein